ncbi:DoxX family protein [Lentzea sp. PSKA42]|jgi:putative oxidoreductase|uniref:DoxX family protein n=1 Tax=Lentzea indica TaxID=2604800 RepID=A0ABX1FRR4_9PSEU|nr:DoxX family protein [Lentzea indica]NKE61605.1 DoxX family protein [Lentzea indica]
MQFLEQRRDQALALFRIVIGLLFLIHGAQKISKGTELLSWPGGPAMLIELIGGALVLIGLWTRWAALLCSGAMAYAYFVVHQPRGLLPIQNGGELAAVYSWAFLLLAFTGAGAWSIDQLLRKSSKKSLANA